MSRLQKITPWRNMLAAAILLMSSLGLNASGMTLFYQPVAQSLGFSQAEFSLYFTLTSLSSTIVMPFVGIFISKHLSKLKIILFFAMVVNVVCMMLYAICRSLPAFYAVSLVRGVAYSFTSGIPATVIVNMWFQDKRSFATSCVFLGASAGGVLFTQLSRFFIDNFTWQTAYVALAAADAVLGAVILCLLTKAPAAMGLKPYTDGTSAAAQKLDPNKGFMRGQVMRMPMFWLFCGGVLIANIVSMAVQQNITSALMTDYGRSSVFAANVFTVYQVAGAAGSLSMGWLADRKGFGPVVITLGILLLAGMGFMLGGSFAVTAVLFALCYGMGNSAAGVIPSSMTADIFGLKDYSSIYGMMSTCLMCGMSIGPLISGLIYDNTGNYTALWIMALVLNVLIVPMIYIPYRRRHSGKMPTPDERAQLKSK